MLLRRSLYYAQFAMAIIMPTWVLVSRGILADGIGAKLIVYLVVCPILTLAMVVMATIIAARGSVRAAKALSWRDVALQLAIWLTLFTYGLFAYPLLAVIVVLLVIGGFWFVLVELLREAKTWVTTMLETPSATKQRSNIDGPTSGPNVIVVPPEPRA
jgi:hypothetical protein